MRRLLIAVSLAGCSVAAQAAVTPDEEAMVRCQVDFDIAYELMVPIAEGETEEQAFAKLRPRAAAIAQGFRDLSRQASLEIVSWTHLTQSDEARLAEVERAEEAELFTAIDGAQTDAEEGAAYDLVLDRVEACDMRFPALMEAI